jgi:perosamine synthetase
MMVTLVSDRIDKEELIRILGERGIEGRPFFYPLSSLPAYGSRDASAENPVAYRLSPHAINLPSALSLTRAQVRQVCAAVKAAPGFR